MSCLKVFSVLFGCPAADSAKLRLPRQDVAPLILGKSDLLVGDGALFSSAVETITLESKHSSGRKPEASNSSQERSESRLSSS